MRDPSKIKRFFISTVIMYILFHQVRVSSALRMLGGMYLKESTIKLRILRNIYKISYQKQIVVLSYCSSTERKPSIFLICVSKYFAQNIALSTNCCKPLMPRVFHINQNFIASILRHFIVLSNVRIGI